ncbi:GNAT family N-acetyltransferase [Zunongwangia sp. F363]|uniref:GNAT family N-acetyltransferase n=1 Tax=Autumnicola tepida TaxID=3075595 RepID=A0ABU3CD33_9FLAO|nr:GNAT family N-acetyltransferase [Zunongwangia sp. F363]MDT0644231.1 GNAT family N-acetyltransferase [Zunongwangia sp. F363]
MKLQLRKVEEKDCLLLFKWINDPEVRKNALTPKEIGWEEHQEWFSNRTRSENTKLYILENEAEPVGQIRFDWENDYWKISYSVEKNSRGQGLGTKILELGLNKIDGKVKAWVKADNPKSKKIFEKLGFHQVAHLRESVEYELIK